MVDSVIKKYSFWKLIRAQWSWNNDKIGLAVNLSISVLLTLSYILSGDIVYSETGSPVQGIDIIKGFFVVSLTYFVMFTLVYHTLKLIIMTIACSLVCYLTQNKFSKHPRYREAVEMYKEMLTCRR